MNQRIDSIWEAFWREQRLACCGAGDANNYREELTDAWRRFFAGMSGSDLVVDVCTGNGAIALLALESANKAGISPELHGVDSAAIDPPHYVSALAEELEKIRFHSQTSITDMPFADESVDLVTSQYGIEYTPIEASVAEIARIMKPGAKGQFIVHAKTGITANSSVDEIREIDEISGDGRLFELARVALSKTHAVESSNSSSESRKREAQDAAVAFVADLRRIADDWQNRKAPFLFQSTGSLLEDTFAKRRLFPVEDLIAKVDETELRLQQHRDRLQALLEAALSEDEVSKVLRYFTQHHFLVAECAELYDHVGNDLLGFRLSVRR